VRRGRSKGVEDPAKRSHGLKVGIFHDPLEVVLQNLLLILVCKGPTVPLPQPLDKVFAASYIRPEVEEPSVGITLTNVCDPGALLLPSLLNDQPT
jgi:hypothetical protein